MDKAEFSIWTAEVARVGEWTEDGRKIASLDVGNGWVALYRPDADEIALDFIGSACIEADGKATLFTAADVDLEGTQAVLTLREYNPSFTGDSDDYRVTFTNAKPGYVIADDPRPAWPDLAPCHLVGKVTS